jgi:hypothetical protein
MLSIKSIKSINHIFAIASNTIKQITRATQSINKITFVSVKPLDHTVAINHANAMLECRRSRTNINASRKTGTPPPILLLIVLAPFPFLPSNLPKWTVSVAPAKRTSPQISRFLSLSLSLSLQFDPLFSRFSFSCLLRSGLDELALPERRRVPEILVRFPRRALARSHLFHHLVDLLESEASRLRHEEVGPEDTAAAQSAPDEKHFGAEVAVAWVDHIGDDDACDGVSKKSTDAVFGCVLPIMQFQNQFDAVEMATPLERMGSWKISPIMTHPAGPQVL